MTASMARSNGQPAARERDDVFGAVFPMAVLKPPKQAKRFDRTQTLSIDAVKSQLTDDGRICLGIGVVSSTSSFVQVTNFQPYFPNHQTWLSTSQEGDEAGEVYHQEVVKTKSWAFMPSWKVDFGAERLQKLVATVVDTLVSEFVNWSYGGFYEYPAVQHLQQWVERILWPFASLMLGRLNKPKASNVDCLASNQLQRWKDMAVTRLADLRIAELFEIIVDWDTTTSAVDDLRSFTTNTATRSYLTLEFATTLSRRLLHPGASTIEILQVYISIIKAFRRLDAKGVLLDKVASKIRKYLREREDTVKVVVAGLLADITEGVVQNDPEILSELAIELQQRDSGDSHGKDADLDWNNMDWVPDPVDAAPDYTKSKSTDVIGSLISLFESKDVFVKELQTVLAERLLKNKADFDQEISVVEHLKIRFGDAILQGCEVMLRDVLDSHKLDQVIRQDQNMQAVGSIANGPTEEPELHTKILSRLFWPSLQEHNFNVPIVIQEQQSKYEKGFESLKQSRKLTWLNAIGQVEVYLELDDRIFHDEVLPWQASVIYAFQNKSEHTITSLETHLAMNTTLVRSACMFWTAKGVLGETPGQRDTFHVAESLHSEANLDINTRLAGGRQSSSTTGVADDTGHINAVTVAAAAAQAEAAANQAAREAEAIQRKQKMAMYHQFVISMLTNQGPMPLARILMMLGIVVPGGFPFGNEELREFLNGMVKEGVLEVGNAGNYKVV